MLNTTTESSPDAAPPAPSKARRLRVMLGALLVIAAVMALVWALTPEPPRVERLEVPKGWPNPQGSFKNSVVRRMPMWVWRARDWVRGPKRGVMIEATFVMQEEWSAADVERLGLGAPSFAETNGVRVWLASSNQMNAARTGLLRHRGAATSSSMRVQTADGVPAMIMSGAAASGNGASLNLEITGWFEPVIRGEVLDLKAIFSCVPPQQAAASTPGQPSINARAVVTVNSTPTNGATSRLLVTPQLDTVAVRVQLREGEEMLVVQENRAALGGRPFVIFLKAAPVPKK